MVSRILAPNLLPPTFIHTVPASGREICEADDDESGVEYCGEGEEDGHGEIGPGVVQEAGKGHND